MQNAQFKKILWAENESPRMWCCKEGVMEDGKEKVEFGRRQKAISEILVMNNFVCRSKANNKKCQYKGQIISK